MISDPSPLELPEILIPAPLRAELHMAGGRFWSDDRYLRFRADPGRAFELHGFVLDAGDGRYHAGFSQRYQPDGQPTCVTAGTGLTADTIPDHLRHGVAHAKHLVASRPGWHRTWKQTSEWLIAWPLTVPDVAVHVKDTIAGRAHDTRATHFAYHDGDRIVCSANPPQTGLFFSVTPHGRWSAHEGPDTFPLECAPGKELSGDPADRSPARLAAGDHPQADVMTVPHVAPDAHSARAHRPRISALPAAGRGR